MWSMPVSYCDSASGARLLDCQWNVAQWSSCCPVGEAHELISCSSLCTSCTAACCMLVSPPPRSRVRVLALDHSITGNAAVRAMPYVPPSPFSNHLAMNRLVTQTGNEATLLQGRLLQLRTMLMPISHPMAARRPLAHNMSGALTSTTSLLRNRLRCRHLRWSMTQASMCHKYRIRSHH
jgi:hypothetical protein